MLVASPMAQPATSTSTNARNKIGGWRRRVWIPQPINRMRAVTPELGITAEATKYAVGLASGILKKKTA